MVKSGLIGYTGFVGSNLNTGERFSHLYNSKNIAAIDGETFNSLVCAGTPAIKWWANKNPEEDEQRIELLKQHLAQIECDKFVLISTVDVYPDPENQHDERTEPARQEGNAYGSNRLSLEQWVLKQFVESLVIRLPALFGKNLKKNIIYDLLNDNQIDKINPSGVFQWYDLSMLLEHIEKLTSTNIRVVNLVPEPIPVEKILARRFAGVAVGKAMQPAPVYDLKTMHDGHFGREDGYIQSAEDSLQRLLAFIDSQRVSR